MPGSIVRLVYAYIAQINTLYRKAYYEDNGTYPEIVETEFMVDSDGTELKCILPCSGSSECDCLSGWSVTQVNDISEVNSVHYYNICMVCACIDFYWERYL